MYSLSIQAIRLQQNLLNRYAEDEMKQKASIYFILFVRQRANAILGSRTAQMFCVCYNVQLVIVSIAKRETISKVNDYSLVMTVITDAWQTYVWLYKFRL